MSTMKNIGIIYKKQVKDTGKNITLLIQFVMFPVMAAIMEHAVQVENMPENFFVGMFAVMHIGMAPLTVTTAIISEEKEKNTMRMLLFADVKPIEYFCGIGGFVLSACMIGGILFGVMGGYTGRRFLLFLLIMAAGILVSALLGAAIGIWSKSQIAATSVVTPMMMIFAFVPMLAMFNDTIEKVADIAYSQHVRLLMDTLQNGTTMQPKNVIVIVVNIIAAAALFVYAYRKKGLT